VVALLALLLVQARSVPPRPGPATWRLSAKPTFSVGAVLGPEDQVFGEVIGAARLSSGTVVVADGMAGELRYFDPDGKLLRRAGSPGEGPREFIHMIRVARCRGDTLFVADAQRTFLQVWTPRATYAGIMDLSGLAAQGVEDLQPHIFACNDRGTMVFVDRRPAIPEGGGDGPTRSVVPIVVKRPDGSLFKLGNFQGQERYFYRHPGGGSSGPRPLGKRTLVAVGDSLIYVGTGDAYEVALYSLNGQRVGTLRDSVDTRPITHELVDTYIDRVLGETEDAAKRRAARSRYEALKYPDRTPAYLDMLAGRGGRLWIEAFRLPGDPQVWRVYTAKGKRVATVRMPPRFQLMEAGEDYILGVWRDGNDVEYVRMYGLVNP
jgi:hypothetical protein